MAVEGTGSGTSLNTFGAVLRFAIDLEERVAHFYAEAAALAQSPQVSDLLLGMSSARERRSQEVARIRRENVAEMILEPVSGMDGAAYMRDLSPAGHVSDSDRLRMATLLEGDAERFYLDASNRLSIAEVNRLLKRLARECGQARARAEALAQG